MNRLPAKSWPPALLLLLLLAFHRPCSAEPWVALSTDPRGVIHSLSDVDPLEGFDLYAWVGGVTEPVTSVELGLTSIPGVYWQWESAIPGATVSYSGQGWSFAIGFPECMQLAEPTAVLHVRAVLFQGGVGGEIQILGATPSHIPGGRAGYVRCAGDGVAFTGTPPGGSQSVGINEFGNECAFTRVLSVPHVASTVPGNVRVPVNLSLHAGKAGPFCPLPALGRVEFALDWDPAVAVFVHAQPADVTAGWTLSAEASSGHVAIAISAATPFGPVLPIPAVCVWLEFALSEAGGHTPLHMSQARAFHLVHSQLAAATTVASDGSLSILPIRGPTVTFGDLKERFSARE